MAHPFYTHYTTSAPGIELGAPFLLFTTSVLHPAGLTNRRSPPPPFLSYTCSLIFVSRITDQKASGDPWVKVALVKMCVSWEVQQTPTAHPKDATRKSKCGSGVAHCFRAAITRMDRNAPTQLRTMSGSPGIFAGSSSPPRILHTRYADWEAS